ncbi:hypothetical protein [Pseudomonas sp. PS01301]|uniref:hypothetical protein n=1 Tax=Pseudomonas sp. PS01301 TaxID=2991437 RepID=UPI00249C58DC|nr:hypothetical protein [Pseudomonas sp. PS01301]
MINLPLASMILVTAVLVLVMAVGLAHIVMNDHGTRKAASLGAGAAAVAFGLIVWLWTAFSPLAASVAS